MTKPCRVCKKPVEVPDEVDLFAKVANKMAAAKNLVPLSDAELAIHASCRPIFSETQKTAAPRWTPPQPATDNRSRAAGQHRERDREPGDDDE